MRARKGVINGAAREAQGGEGEDEDKQTAMEVWKRSLSLVFLFCILLFTKMKTVKLFSIFCLYCFLLSG